MGSDSHLDVPLAHDEASLVQDVDDPPPVNLTSVLWEDILFKKVFPRLSVLDLFNLRAVSRDCQAMVDAYFVEMTSLSLSQFATKFPQHHFAVLCRLCCNLREVKLASCEFLTTPLLTELFSRNNKITTLILDKTNNLESSCLQHVIIDCKNLKVLRLKECNWVTVGCLDALTLHHTNLEELDLSYCSAISGHRSLTLFLRKLPRLRTLRLAGHYCHDSTLMTVLTCCRALEMLDLSHGQSSSSRVKELTEGLPKLKALFLMGHTFTDDRHAGDVITWCLNQHILAKRIAFRDDLAAELIEGLAKLQFLDLRSHTFYDHAYTKDSLKVMAYRRSKMVVLTNSTYQHGVPPFLGVPWHYYPPDPNPLPIV